MATILLLLDQSPTRGTTNLSPAPRRWVTDNSRVESLQGRHNEHPDVPRVTVPDAHLHYDFCMSHTHASNLVHCVFSTKDRANLIEHPDALCRYISGIAHAKHITLLAAGGTANHLHLLISLPTSMPLAQAMRDLKGNSSRMLGDMGKRFSWQEGYGAFRSAIRSDRSWPITSRTSGAPPEVEFRAGVCGLVGQGGRRIRSTIRVRMILVPSLQDSVLSHVYPALKRWARFFAPIGARKLRFRALSQPSSRFAVVQPRDGAYLIPFPGSRPLSKFKPLELDPINANLGQVVMCLLR